MTLWLWKVDSDHAYSLGFGILAIKRKEMGIMGTQYMNYGDTNMNYGDTIHNS